MCVLFVLRESEHEQKGARKDVTNVNTGIFKVTDFLAYSFRMFTFSMMSWSQFSNLKNHNKDIFILKAKRQGPLGGSPTTYPPPSPHSPSLFLGVHFPERERFIEL